MTCGVQHIHPSSPSRDRYFLCYHHFPIHGDVFIFSLLSLSLSFALTVYLVPSKMLSIAQHHLGIQLNIHVYANRNLAQRTRTPQLCFRRLTSCLISLKEGESLSKSGCLMKGKMT